MRTNMLQHAKDVRTNYQHIDNHLDTDYNELASSWYSCTGMNRIIVITITITIIVIVIFVHECIVYYQ